MTTSRVFVWRLCQRRQRVKSSFDHDLGKKVRVGFELHGSVAPPAALGMPSWYQWTGKLQSCTAVCTAFGGLYCCCGRASAAIIAHPRQHIVAHHLHEVLDMRYVPTLFLALAKRRRAGTWQSQASIALKLWLHTRLRGSEGPLSQGWTANPGGPA